MVIISLGQEHRRTQRDRKVKLLQVKTNYCSVMSSDLATKTTTKLGIIILSASVA